MSVQGRGKNLVDQDNDRVAELTNSLREVERKLSEREALINQAFDQTEAARSQYSQAVERAEALSRRLDAGSAELKAANESIAALTEKVASLESELQLRDSRIAFLEQMCAENENALEAIHDDIDRSDSALHVKPLTSGYVMESLDNLDAQHRICRTTTTIGRASSNDISINATSISRYHARLVIEPEGLFLVDLKSTNGCRVNGQKITRRKLSDGDVVLIGEAKFRLSTQPIVAEVGDDTASSKPGFDDQMFTHTVVSLSRTAIQELPVRAKA